MMPYEEERVRKKKRFLAGTVIGIAVIILAYGPAVFGHGGREKERREMQDPVISRSGAEETDPGERTDSGIQELKEASYAEGEAYIGELFSRMTDSQISGSYDKKWQEKTEVLSCPSWAEPVRIVTVTDGDTLFVEQINGEKKHVRLLEVNTPESGKAEAAGYARATDYGEMAAAFTKKVIYEMSPSGEDVILYLSKDIGESPSETDKYGRLLRIVWLEKPPEKAYSDPEAIRISTLQGVLLSEGMAEAVYYDDSGYKDVFDELENEAKVSGKGLWAYGEEAFEKQDL